MAKLTKEDLQLCRMLGTNPDEVLAHKQREERKTTALRVLSTQQRETAQALGVDPVTMARREVVAGRVGARGFFFASAGDAPAPLSLPPELATKVDQMAELMGMQPEDVLAKAVELGLEQMAKQEPPPKAPKAA